MIRRAVAAAIVLLAAAPAVAEPLGTIQDRVCHMVEDAAAANRLPVGFLTRVLWVESRFHPMALSPKGAEGMAQFMPQTAAERGLSDPFDPAQAIAHAARLLAEQAEHLGNLGLAAAAYNAGSARVDNWLHAKATLPLETRNYVAAVTGQTAEAWAVRGLWRGDLVSNPESCVALTAELARASFGRNVPAPVWQARLDGTLAKAIEGLTRLAREEKLDPKRPARDAMANRFCASVRVLGAACAIYRQ
jgi:uncharacterized protein (DUF2267 family)